MKKTTTAVMQDPRVTDRKAAFERASSTAPEAEMGHNAASEHGGTGLVGQTEATGPCTSRIADTH